MQEYRVNKAIRDFETVDYIFFPKTVGKVWNSKGRYKSQPIKDYLFTYIVNGEYYLSPNNSPDEKIKCKKNTLAVYKPGQVFSIEPITDNSKRLWIHMEGSVVSKLLQELKLDENGLCSYPEGTDYIVLEYFNELMKNIGNWEKNKLYVFEKMLSLIRIFARSDNYSMSIEENVKRTLNYIDDNLANKINIETLANICNITPTYYIQVFKKIHGMTPHQLINNRRLEKAKYYLDNSNMTITEIANACGFYDRGHFSNSFKKKFGYSPTRKNS